MLNETFELRNFMYKVFIQIQYIQDNIFKFYINIKLLISIKKKFYENDK